MSGCPYLLVAVSSLAILDGTLDDIDEPPGHLGEHGKGLGDELVATALGLAQHSGLEAGNTDMPQPLVNPGNKSSDFLIEN